MLSAGSLFLISASLFVVYALLVKMEWGRGRRFFLNRFREWLDVRLSAVYLSVTTKVRHIIRHTIKLSWYYSLHSALRAVLTLLVKMYDSLELVFINNRERAKKLRAERRALREEKNHLTVIGEHKASTALTTKEKKKLKAKSLAGE